MLILRGRDNFIHILKMICYMRGTLYSNTFNSWQPIGCLSAEPREQGVPVSRNPITLGSPFAVDEFVLRQTLCQIDNSNASIIIDHLKKVSISSHDTNWALMLNRIRSHNVIGFVIINPDHSNSECIHNV